MLRLLRLNDGGVYSEAICLSRVADWNLALFHQDAGFSVVLLQRVLGRHLLNLIRRFLRVLLVGGILVEDGLLERAARQFLEVALIVHEIRLAHVLAGCVCIRRLRVEFPKVHLVRLILVYLLISGHRVEDFLGLSLFDLAQPQLFCSLLAERLVAAQCLLAALLALKVVLVEELALLRKNELVLAVGLVVALWL